LSYATLGHGQSFGKVKFASCESPSTARLSRAQGAFRFAAIEFDYSGSVVRTEKVSQCPDCSVG
jgi:hypothetical protein